MSEQQPKPVGLSKDAGYQVGARKTFPVAFEEAWEFLTSKEGVKIWLGENVPFPLTKGTRYELEDGTTGVFRVYHPYSHLRLTWQPPGWIKASVIQLRVIERGDKTVLAFHQEHLPNGEEREKRRVYFQQVLDQLENHWPLLR